MNDIVKQDASLAGWEAPGNGEQNPAALAMVQREKTELESAIIVAKRFPRDEAAAYTGIIRACQRPGFAEGARYAFPRGGSTVSGPSVQLAREMARLWGNIRYGLRIVSVDDDQVHIRGYALDVETNGYVEAEDRFAKLVQRKRNGRTAWVEPDERDLRELVNRRGAILVRNCILQILPPDITEDAQRSAQETLRKAASGELSQDRQAAIRRLALAFDALGVTTEMLVAHLGHDLALLTEDELAELRGVFASIRDGHTKRADHFELVRRDVGASDVNARLEAEAEPPEAPTPVECTPSPEATPAASPTADSWATLREVEWPGDDAAQAPLMDEAAKPRSPYDRHPQESRGRGSARGRR